MKQNELLQIILFFGVLIGLAPLLGAYLARVFEGQTTISEPTAPAAGTWIYRLGGVDEREEMSWKRYFRAVLIFNVVGLVILDGAADGASLASAEPAEVRQRALGAGAEHGHQFHHEHQLAGLLGRIDHELPDADGRPGRAQLSQRGHGHRRAGGVDSRTEACPPAKTLGNFWVDLTRATLYVLLPSAADSSPIVLVSQGVVQSFSPYVTVKTLGGRGSGLSRSVRRHRRSPSSNSARTAAGFSVRTAPIRSRTRRR